ncbi:MAG: transaldolase family protein [Candidatus Beckwithbacteria bacterium]
MTTRIFLDSADPQETKVALELLGKLDGQTTNPSLIAKNPQVQDQKFSKEEVYAFYQKVVEEISRLIPNGSVSVEVYADMTTSVEQILTQAKEMNTWIPNAHIKLPIIKNGLVAAEQLVKESINVNLTLCFSQQQAAAVYAATKGAKKGQVFLSPFIGRLDDKGINGLDLIKNILEMYKNGDGHVEVLSASIRNLNHHLSCIKLQTDLITSPLSILKQWQKKQVVEPIVQSLKPMNYEEVDLNQPWESYQLQQDLTDAGLEKFCADWQGMIK